MKHYWLVFMIQIGFVFLGIGQSIPEEYVVDWSNAGLTKEITLSNSVNIKNYGAIGDGINDEHASIIKALENLNDQPGIVFFPPGKYLIKSSLTIPSNVIIRGASSDSTFLEFDLNKSMGNCFNINASQSGVFIPIIKKSKEGEINILVDNPENFKEGDFVEIRMKNGDWNTKPADWAEYCVGQISIIDDVDGKTIKLKDKLRFELDLELDPEIRIINPITNVGLEYFSMSRVDEPATGGPYNIYMGYANNSWIKGVESAKSIGSHVILESSYSLSISGSYFHSAYSYDGASTHGYGITLIQHTSNCLIENNVFKNLRHSMMVKQGANGNVFGYNYSYEPKRDEFPTDAGGDISCHGHYPFSNLFEGNLVQTIHIDQAWGPNGPRNTFFRNRSQLYGIIVSSGSVESNKQLIIGNEVTNKSFLKGNYTINGTDHFEYANLVKDKVIPDNNESLDKKSFYLDAKPSFWLSALKWPSIGLSSNLKIDLPALERVKQNGKITVGPEINATSVNQNIFGYNKLKIKLLNSLFKQFVNIEIYSPSNQNLAFEIRSISGQIILKTEKEINKGYNLITLNKYTLSELEPSWYILRVNGKGLQKVFKILKRW